MGMSGINHEENCAACGVNDRADNSQYCVGCRDTLVRTDGGTVEDDTERPGELERFAVECALNAAWATEFWIPAEPDYGFVDYVEAAAARNLGLLRGFEDLAEDATRRGILPQTDSDQARLVTDGGNDHCVEAETDGGESA